MGSSLNRVHLIGNLGRDPESRSTQDGKIIVSLSLATSDSWKDRKTGERRERTEWHRVVIFNEGLAGVAQQYLRKGSKVYLSGELQTRKWTDQGGTERYTTEIVLRPYHGEMVLLDAKPTAGGNARTEEPAAKGREARVGDPTGAIDYNNKDLDDEIPF